MMNYTSKFFSSVGNTLGREVRKSCAWQFYSTLAQSVEERIVVPQMGDSITEGNIREVLEVSREIKYRLTKLSP